jgi:hypothetical protein
MTAVISDSVLLTSCAGNSSQHADDSALRSSFAFPARRTVVIGGQRPQVLGRMDQFRGSLEAPMTDHMIHRRLGALALIAAIALLSECSLKPGRDDGCERRGDIRAYRVDDRTARCCRVPDARPGSLNQVSDAASSAA